MTTKAQQTEQEAACEFLRERIQPGDILYTILRHRSRSGMRRHISVVQIDLITSVPRDISRRVADATGRRFHDADHAVICDGAGMDMGFDLVYSLAGELAKASNGPWRADAHDGQYRNPAYALVQRWL